MRFALACIVLLACKSSEQPAASPAKGSAHPVVAQPRVSEAAPPTDDLCDAYDRAGVATAFGWKGMQKTSATGLKHGDKRERHCSYHAMDEAAKDGMFSVSFDTDLTIQKKHIGYDIAYAKHEPIDGNETWTGHSADVVAVQVIAKGLRISTELAKSGTVEDMEPRLVQATRTIIGSLPADPLPLMHK